MPQTFDVVCEKNDEIAEEVQSIWFKLNGPLEFKAGQFMTMLLPKGEVMVRKMYSIASAPYITDRFELCVNRVTGGFGSNFLCDLKPGVKLQCIGPYGVFILQEPLQNDPVFIATGTGVAPLKSMLDTIWEKKLDGGRTIWLFFGARTPAHLIYHKEFEKMAQEHPNFKYHPIISRDESWSGLKGHVQDHFAEHIADPAGKEAYVCGLTVMVSDVRKTLSEMGYPKEQVHFENYV
ncbi:MAG TPA: FAD-dependent oxidoreductase [Candidatus Nanoarchaeia archaeon]|nr:FAD-dependent oxidoreductase [Candidatus Nanoarchaeia archaeon]